MTKPTAHASITSLPGRLERIARTIERVLGRPAVLVAALAVFIPCYVVYFGSSAAFSIGHAVDNCAGQPILDMRWWSDPQTVGHYFTECGGPGLAAIRSQQMADLLYPALYAVVLTSAIALLVRLLRSERPAVHLLVLVPAIIAGLDYLENVGIWLLLAGLPDLPPVFPWLPLITATKQTLGYVCAAIVALLLGAVAWRRLRGLATRAR